MERKAALRLDRAAGEAMEDRRVGRALGREDRERLVPGVAGMDHQWQAVVVGEMDLLREHRPLRLAWCVLIEVVEPTLADPDDPTAGRILQQRLDPVEAVDRIVGMQAGGGPHIVEAGRAAYGRQRRRLVAAHRDHPGDAGGAGDRDSLFGIDALVVEMAVRVGPRHRPMLADLDRAS